MKQMTTPLIAILVAGGALIAAWYWVAYFPSRQVTAGGYEISLLQPLAGALPYAWVLAPIAIVALVARWRKPSRPLATVLASAFTAAWLIAGAYIPAYWQDDQVRSWQIQPTITHGNQPGYSIVSTVYNFEQPAPPMYEALPVKEYSARVPDPESWVLRPRMVRRTFNVYGVGIGHRMRYEPEWEPELAARLKEGFQVSIGH